MKFPTYEEMVKSVAETALDNFEYQGKSIREWIKIITEQEPILDNIRAKIKDQIDYHDEEHRKYDSEEEFGISLGLELALAIVNKEVELQESEVEK